MRLNEETLFWAFIKAQLVIVVFGFVGIIGWAGYTVHQILINPSVSGRSDDEILVDISLGLGVLLFNLALLVGVFQSRHRVI